MRRAFLDLCSETSEYVSSVEDIFAGGDREVIGLRVLC